MCKKYISRGVLGWQAGEPPTTTACCSCSHVICSWHCLLGSDGLHIQEGFFVCYLVVTPLNVWWIMWLCLLWQARVEEDSRDMTDVRGICPLWRQRREPRSTDAFSTDDQLIAYSKVAVYKIAFIKNTGLAAVVLFHLPRRVFVQKSKGFLDERMSNMTC